LVAKSLWTKSVPAKGTPVETYLKKRSLNILLPATLRFLPPTGDYPPTMLAAFGMAQESEPGVLFVPPDAIRAIHLTRLKPDGIDKADIPNSKIILGRGASGVPIVVAPPNDLLGLAITEGIEEALSVHAATGLGAWAAGSASRMPALADAVPEFIECVKIVADDDNAGRKFSLQLAERLTSRGITVSWKLLGVLRVAAS
jgi:hypothetical protein